MRMGWGRMTEKTQRQTPQAIFYKRTGKYKTCTLQATHKRTGAYIRAIDSCMLLRDLYIIWELHNIYEHTQHKERHSIQENCMLYDYYTLWELYESCMLCKRTVSCMSCMLYVSYTLYKSCTLYMRATLHNFLYKTWRNSSSRTLKAHANSYKWSKPQPSPSFL